MLTKIPTNNINDTKNALFFLSWAPTHHSFTFNLWFLYELKDKVHLSKTVCLVFSIFDSVSFLLKFIFLFNKVHGLFDFETSQFFSKLKWWKSDIQFCLTDADLSDSGPLIFKLQREVSKFNDICVSGASQKLTL